MYVDDIKCCRLATTFYFKRPTAGPSALHCGAAEGNVSEIIRANINFLCGSLYKYRKEDSNIFCK